MRCRTNYDLGYLLRCILMNQHVYIGHDSSNSRPELQVRGRNVFRPGPKYEPPLLFFMKCWMFEERREECDLVKEDNFVLNKTVGVTRVAADVTLLSESLDQ